MFQENHKNSLIQNISTFIYSIYNKILFKTIYPIKFHIFFKNNLRKKNRIYYEKNLSCIISQV